MGMQAVARFPEDVVARNGLAEVLKAQDRLEEAEAVYREAVARFPDDAFAHTGLAEVLKAQDRLQEAEAVYREAVARFPDNVVARTGLAEGLKAQGRLEEAEAVYRKAVARFPDNVFARAGLAGVLLAKGEVSEAAALYSAILSDDTDNEVAKRGLQRIARGETTAGAERTEAAPRVASPVSRPGGALYDAWDDRRARERVVRPEADLSADDVQIILGDAYLLRLVRRQPGQPGVLGVIRERTRVLLQKLGTGMTSDPRVATEKGLLHLTEGDVEEATFLLRQAARRFPGSARVRYALARAERERARIVGCKLDAAAEREVLAPWRGMERRDARYRPVRLLGEGRSYLCFSDGGEATEGARRAFASLDKWLSSWTSGAPLGGDAGAAGDDGWNGGSEDRFRARWAGWVWEAVFSGVDPPDELGAVDVAALATRLTQSAVSVTLDTYEEEFVFRYSLV